MIGGVNLEYWSIFSRGSSRTSRPPGTRREWSARRARVRATAWKGSQIGFVAGCRLQVRSWRRVSRVRPHERCVSECDDVGEVSERSQSQSVKNKMGEQSKVVISLVGRATRDPD